MTIKKLNLAVVALALAGMVRIWGAADLHKLETHGGIKNGVVCTYTKTEVIDPKTGHKKDHYVVTCADGSHFDNVVEVIGSSTGTPAWLTYTNFIGSYIVAGTESRMPGATRAALLFDGQPQVKKADQNKGSAQKNYMIHVLPRHTSEKLALPLPDQTPDGE